jgi:LPS export ABC transporter protein LptC
LLVLAVLHLSCEKKTEKIKDIEILNLPTVTGMNFQSVFDDSGKVQLIMSAPIMESYENTKDPYTEFKSGISILFFEGKKDTIAKATAKYARYTVKKKLWELKDSVVVINESRDKLETEQLFWDQDKDHIYTDRFVKITSQDQEMMGTGFESDSRLTRRKIKNYTGSFYLRDE